MMVARSAETTAKILEFKVGIQPTVFVTPLGC